MPYSRFRQRQFDDQYNHSTQSIAKNIEPMKGVTYNNGPEAALLQAEMLYQVKILCRLYCAGEKKNGNHQGYRLDPNKGFDEIIDEHDHEQITAIGPHQAIVYI